MQLIGANFDELKIVEEFINGSKLIDAIRLRLSLAEALKLGLQISEAMEYMHEQNIIHRDLNPCKFPWLIAHL